MRDYATISKRLRRYSENCVAYKLDADFANAVTDAADAIEELLDELTTIRKQLPHWISVEERLPEDGAFVLVCNDDGHMMIAKYESEVAGWYYKYTNYDFDSWDNEEQGPVLHWMPLPTPPKGVLPNGEV